MTVEVAFHLNGMAMRRQARADARLVDLLREDLGLCATKLGCGVGRCGACTVLLDGVAVNACLVMAHRVDGAELVTTEGLDAIPAAASLRAALTEGNAFQCGYCAPGMVMSLLMLPQDGGVDPALVAAAITGNLCRCTGYGSILRAATRWLCRDRHS